MELDRPIRLLIIEDSQDDADLDVLELRRGGIRTEPLRVDTAAALEKALATQEWDLIIADYSLPGFTGLDALQIVKSRGLDIPFILVSGTIGEELAVAAMRAGVQDYLMKENLSRLVPVVTRELQECELRKRHRAAQVELLRSQEKLQQSQKLEAIGRLAGGISHDFNNLLTVISGYNDMTMASMEPSNPLLANLEQIKSSVAKAASLTRQLLAFSRKQVLMPQIIDLNTVVHDMFRLLKPLIREDIRLSISAAQDMGKVKADPGQIQQVIMNLVLNARDAMPEGGELYLSTNQAWLNHPVGVIDSDFRPGPYAVLSVRDTGMGMDKDTLTRIFEPFFTTKESGKGTGLGLSMVYGILSQSGGQIKVSSEPGTGTSIEVYLPLARPEDNPPLEKTQPVEALASREGHSVLLVEDDESLRGMVKKILEANGYRVRDCRNGQDALEVAEKEEAIDLLFTDLVMPDMGGLQLAKAILPRHPEASLLCMSGYAEGTEFPAEIAGRNPNFLPKPFTTDQLLGMARNALEQFRATYAPR